MDANKSSMNKCFKTGHETTHHTDKIAFLNKLPPELKTTVFNMILDDSPHLGQVDRNAAKIADDVLKNDVENTNSHCGSLVRKCNFEVE